MNCCSDESEHLSRNWTQTWDASGPFLIKTETRKSPLAPHCISPNKAVSDVPTGVLLTDRFRSYNHWINKIKKLCISFINVDFKAQYNWLKINDQSSKFFNSQVGNKIWLKQIIYSCGWSMRSCSWTLLKLWQTNFGNKNTAEIKKRRTGQEKQITFDPYMLTVLKHRCQKT